MRLSVLDRYIIAEFFPPFLFGLGIFLSVGLSVGAVFELVREIAESGLDLTIAVRVLALRVPQFLAYAFPMSTLLATLMAYGRLANDNEIVALRSAGFGIYRLAVPILVVSLVVTGWTFAFNETIVPEANFRSRNILSLAAGSSRLPLQRSNVLVTQFDDRPGSDDERRVLALFLYAEQFDGERLLGVTAIDRSSPDLERIVNAASARLDPAANLWEFYDGTMYLVAPDASYRDVIRFNRQTLSLPRSPLDFTKPNRNFEEMNLLQAIESLEVVRAEGKDAKLRKLQVRIQEKVAFPFVCFVFGTIGTALGVNPSRMNRATSFGISTMAIFIYYLLAFMTSALGVVGALPPVVAAWLPNIAGLGLGLLLLLRTAR